MHMQRPKLRITQTIEPDGVFRMILSAVKFSAVKRLTNFGAWAEAGAKTSTQRATDIWTKNLEGFQDPVHCDTAASNIDAFIEMRKQKGGAFPQE
jgi:trimethylamine:corrinoid methyltransferase-like protein